MADTIENKGRRGRRGGKKRGKVKGKEFMDAALDAFIRSQALSLWRDFTVYRDGKGASTQEALQETGFFGDKGPYADLWLEHWQRATLPTALVDDGAIFGQIEAAVRAAVLDERAKRLATGDVSLEDTDEYNDFIRHALGQLVADAGAERPT